LAAARDFGDVLIVGLNADASVSRLKPGRPLQDEQTRAIVMASLTSVDAVVLFNEDTPYELIKALQPDVLVKGGDYKPETVVGADIVTAIGGKVEIVPLLEGFSTTAIEQKIKGK
jgi:rfaE bifunctional protein nucleotidyltransferase chain/domain